MDWLAVHISIVYYLCFCCAKVVKYNGMVGWLVSLAHAQSQLLWRRIMGPGVEVAHAASKQVKIFVLHGSICRV